MTMTPLPLSDQIRPRRDAARDEVRRLKEQMRELYAKTETRADGALLASEQREFDRMERELGRLEDEAQEYQDRYEELLIDEQRRAAAAQSQRLIGGGAVSAGPLSVNEPATYRRDDLSGPSFFRDMVSASRGDSDAAQRLARNEAEVRAMGNTGGTGGSGGEFAPPAWIVQDFVALARPGRVFADRVTRDVLPSGVSSINIPKVSAGTTTAVQTTQNSALSSTDMTTTSLSSTITTIGGKNVVARQLLDQSAVPLDRVILGDLAADYAKQLDTQFISGSGTSGQLNGVYTWFAASGTSNVTYTQATPAVAGTGGFYAQVNKAIANIATARFLRPTAIIMHPRRWSWVAAAFDGSNRPLVSPSGNAFNQIADAGTVAAEGPIGEMAGLPVYLDANIPTNLGAGTNQDPVFVLRAEDLYLWESDIRMETFPEPYADSAGVLFRCLGYSAAIPNRQASSVSVILGTGLVPPSY